MGLGSETTRTANLGNERHKKSGAGCWAVGGRRDSIDEVQWESENRPAGINESKRVRDAIGVEKVGLMSVQGTAVRAG